MRQPPYPTDIDLVQYVMDAAAFVRGHGSAPIILHDSWKTLGFGLGRFYPIPVDGMVAATWPDAPEDQLAKLGKYHHMGLDELAKVADKVCESANEQKERNAVGNIDWTEIAHLASVMAYKIMEQLWFGKPPDKKLPQITHPTVGDTNRPFTGSIK